MSHFTIGDSIRTARTVRKMSQSLLAKKLGVSKESVSRWEGDKRLPDPSNLIALAELFPEAAEDLGVDKQVLEGFTIKQEAEAPRWFLDAINQVHSKLDTLLAR